MATTHNPNSALVYRGKVLLLRGGTALAQGTTKDAIRPELLPAAYGLPFQVMGDDTGPKAVLSAALPLT